MKIDGSKNFFLRVVQRIHVSFQGKSGFISQQKLEIYELMKHTNFKFPLSNCLLLETLYSETIHLDKISTDPSFQMTVIYTFFPQHETPKIVEQTKLTNHISHKKKKHELVLQYCKNSLWIISSISLMSPIFDVKATPTLELI